MLIRLALLAVLASLFLATGWLETTLSPQYRCEEDQKCWDCHTMGNRVCGPGKD